MTRSTLLNPARCLSWPFLEAIAEAEAGKLWGSHEGRRVHDVKQREPEGEDGIWDLSRRFRERQGVPA